MNGKLGDIGFVELLKMVGKRFGRLSIYAPLERRYDWFIHDFRVFAVRINQEPVKNQEVLFEALLELLHDEESSYSFVNREEIDRFPIEMSFNLENVIAEALKRLTVNDYCRRHFPNPETKFEAVPNSKIQLTDDALLLWKRAEYFFLSGTSAVFVANELRIGLESVRLEFYRWRMMGLIAPVRVFSSVANKSPQQSASWQSLSKPVNTPPNTSAPPVLPEPEATDSPPRILYGESRAQTQYKPYTEKPKNEERQTLVRRMLGALFRK